MRNAGLEEAQAGIKIEGRNINKLRWHHPYGRKWKRTKKPLDESERGEWKSWLKAQHSENRSQYLIPSLHCTYMEKQWKEWQTLFWGLQNHCRWWLQPWNKKHLLLGRKVMTNLVSILKKQRPYFANQGPFSQGVVFPVVMCGCENWTIKNAERWRIDAFELWCWRRLLKSPLGLQGDPTSPS